MSVLIFFVTSSESNKDASEYERFRFPFGNLKKTKITLDYSSFYPNSVLKIYVVIISFFFFKKIRIGRSKNLIIRAKICVCLNTHRSVSISSNRMIFFCTVNILCVQIRLRVPPVLFIMCRNLINNYRMIKMEFRQYRVLM